MPFDFATLIKALRAAFGRNNLSFRYKGFAVLCIAALLCLRVFLQLWRLLDLLLYPGYRRQPIDKLIYIIANPRSGTTFLHRILCQDDQFTYFKLYHTLLPSVALIKVIGRLAKLDQKLGGLLRSTANLLTRKAFRNWTGIHDTRLTEAEEDEQLFLYTLLSPSVFMLFPFFSELSHVAFVDRLPYKAREKLMTYYLDCLKRQIYATGPEKTLLAKNVLIQGRLGSILQSIPDIRIVYLVRHPRETIPSFISMYAAFWRLHSPQLERDPVLTRALAVLLCDYYNCFMEIRRELPEGQLMEISYDDLIADPEGTVKEIYRKFNLNMDEAFAEKLNRESARSRKHKSSHQYSLEKVGLSEELIRDRLGGFLKVYGLENLSVASPDAPDLLKLKSYEEKASRKTTISR